MLIQVFDLKTPLSTTPSPFLSPSFFIIFSPTNNNFHMIHTPFIVFLGEKNINNNKKNICHF